MCPACMGIAALAIAGLTSTGGLVALLVQRITGAIPTRSLRRPLRRRSDGAVRAPYGLVPPSGARGRDLTGASRRARGITNQSTAQMANKVAATRTPPTVEPSTSMAMM